MNYLKGTLILIVLAGIIGGIGYLWQENQITEEQKVLNNEIKLNLSFFTSDFPLNTGATRTESITEWSSAYDDLEVHKYYKGSHQKGFNKNGQMYFRIVRRDTNPPSVTTYWMDRDNEKNQISTSSIFITECLPGKQLDYVAVISNREGKVESTLNCSKDGQYLYSTFMHTYNSPEINKDESYEINANGFLLKFNFNVSTINKLLQNQSLLKLNDSE